MKKNKETVDTYKPMTEIEKLAFLVLSLWIICAPLLFVMMNRNVFKNAISGQLLNLQWALTVTILAAWFFVWKRQQRIKPLLISVLCAILLLTGVVIAVKPKIAYFDAFVYISKQHPELSMQAYVTEEDIKADSSKSLYYLKPAAKPYNYFLTYDYVIYGIDKNSGVLKEFIISPMQDLK